MPEQNWRKDFRRGFKAFGKGFVGAAKSLENAVFDATIGENRRQTNEFIQRAEIAELIRDAKGPNYKRQVVARNRLLTKFGIKI